MHPRTLPASSPKPSTNQARVSLSSAAPRPSTATSAPRNQVVRLANWQAPRRSKSPTFATSGSTTAAAAPTTTSLRSHSANSATSSRSTSQVGGNRGSVSLRYSSPREPCKPIRPSTVPHTYGPFGGMSTAVMDRRTSNACIGMALRSTSKGRFDQKPSVTSNIEPALLSGIAADALRRPNSGVGMKLTSPRTAGDRPLGPHMLPKPQFRTLSREAVWQTSQTSKSGSGTQAATTPRNSSASSSPRQVATPRKVAVPMRYHWQGPLVERVTAALLESIANQPIVALAGVLEGMSARSREAQHEVVEYLKRQFPRGRSNSSTTGRQGSPNRASSSPAGQTRGRGGGVSPARPVVVSKPLGDALVSAHVHAFLQCAERDATTRFLGPCVEEANASYKEFVSKLAVCEGPPKWAEEVGETGGPSPHVPEAVLLHLCRGAVARVALVQLRLPEGEASRLASMDRYLLSRVTEAVTRQLTAQE